MKIPIRSATSTTFPIAAFQRPWTCLFATASVLARRIRRWSSPGELQNEAKSRKGDDGSARSAERIVATRPAQFDNYQPLPGRVSRRDTRHRAAHRGTEDKWVFLA